MEILTQSHQHMDHELRPAKRAEHAQLADRETLVGRLALRLANKAYLGGVWLRHTLGLVANSAAQEPTLAAKHSPTLPRYKQPEAVTLWNTNTPNWPADKLSKPVGPVRVPDFVPNFADYPAAVSEDGALRTMGRVATGRADFERAMRNLADGTDVDDMRSRLQQHREASTKGTIEVAAEMHSKALFNRDDGQVVDQTDPLLGTGLDIDIVSANNPLRPRTGPENSSCN